jgi:putative ABC transport system permease protein
MNWIQRLFSRRHIYSDLSAEMRAHLDEKIHALVASGMSREEATRTARREFGNVTLLEERSREVWQWPSLESFFADIRFAFRMLRKSPGFTAVAILTLALGIGANTAIFSLVDGIILRPLPYPHADRVVHLSWQSQTYLIPNLTTPEFIFIRDHNSSFSSLAAVRDYNTLELKTGHSTQWINAQSVSDGFFETLAVNPELGRPFTREYTRATGPSAALLSDSLWRTAFGGDPNIVGRQIVLDNESYTVTGVLPPGFKYMQPADLFVSLHLGAGMEDSGTNTDVIGRLKSGLSLAQAQAQMPLLTHEFLAQASQLEQQQGPGYIHLDVYQDYLASGHRQSLLMLLSAVGLLLLIACANVASLLLARATSRRKEISIRLALGAGRRRLLQQFLSEGLLLGIAGAVAGLAGAISILRIFVAAIPWDLPSVDRIGLDGRVLLFTSLVAIAASIIFALASFFQTRRLDLNRALKDGRATGPDRSRVGLLNALVVGEIAIAVMLALGAGLLIQSLYNLYQEKLGFNPSHLLLMSTPFSGNPSGAKIWNFEQQAIGRIDAIPGVQSSAIVSAAPLHDGGNIPVQRDGHPEDSIGPTDYRSISANYFSVMGIPVLRGRAFQQDDFTPSAPVAIINETLARDWWPNENPIGGRVVVGEYQGQRFPQIIQPPREVIGVVGDVKGMFLDQPAPPTMYVPASQGLAIFNSSTDWVIRTSAPTGIASALRSAITGIAPDQRIVDLEPMTQLISGSSSVTQTNFESLLMGTFGAIALILTLVGVYGVLSFQVVQRTHEIGVRVALGASPRDVWRLVIGKAIKVSALGVVIGLGAALALTRFIASQLYDVRPTDPVIFAVVAILVLLVSLLAAYIPARRAMRVDPMVALRYE